MLQEELHETIKNFPDFPSKGILFRDILPVLQKPKLYKKLIESMASKDFFNKAFYYSPSKRMTLQQMINHNWLKLST